MIVYGKLFLYLFLLIITILPIWLYLYNFGNLHFSSDLEVWANFGTYLSGVLTPSISIINVILLLNIANSAKKLEKKNISYQLRKEEYVNIKRKIDTFLESILPLNQINAPEDQKRQKAKELIISISSFLEDYEFLYPRLINEQISSDILRVLDQYIENLSIEQFIDTKKHFLQRIQTKYIMEKMDKVNI
jgi:hypothetical protein